MSRLRRWWRRLLNVFRQGRLDQELSEELSTLFDLHVQEHLLTLPRIAAMLRTLGLNFVGFEFANDKTPSRYRLRFPDDPAMTDTAPWSRGVRR